MIVQFFLKVYNQLVFCLSIDDVSLVGVGDISLVVLLDGRGGIIGLLAKPTGRLEELGDANCYLDRVNYKIYPR